MEEILWTIETYETSSIDKPVDEFIKKQQFQAKAKIVHTIKLLKQYGNLLGLPHSKNYLSTPWLQETSSTNTSERARNSLEKDEKFDKDITFMLYFYYE